MEGPVSDPDSGLLTRSPAQRVRDVASLDIDTALSLRPDDLGADLQAVSDGELAGAEVALLHVARLLEPPLRVAERSAALDRLEGITGMSSLLTQSAAERAIDLAKENRLDESEALARSVLDGIGVHEIALARATEALGRVQAWRGTDAAAVRARSLLAEAGRRYASLGARAWQGTVTFWAANTLDYQRGDLFAAERGMREALPLLTGDRKAIVLTYLGDLLAYAGRAEEAQGVLDEAFRLTGGEAVIAAYVTWSLAKLSSYAGDATATVRLVMETDRELAALHLANTTTTFAADAAEMLDRVHEDDLAQVYLRRARDADPDDEFVRVAVATSLARHGDPTEAVAALRHVLLEPWLEARLVWRVTLFRAWAALRRGDADAGRIAGQALEQVVNLGGVEVALATERRLTELLLPAAALAGSVHARGILHPQGTVVQLLGGVAVDGAGVVALPSGRPGELARLVLSHPNGLTSDAVIDTLWPDDDAAIGRRKLRQALSRLGARNSGLLVRRGDRLVGDAWVDLVAFEAAATSALADRDIELGRLALSLRGGTPLPDDPYATWASNRRAHVVTLGIKLLDWLAEAVAETSPEEAATWLELALADDRYDEERYVRAARLRLRLKQRSAARRLADEAAAMLANLGLPQSGSLRELLTELGPGRG